jgi:muramoyltetrapeptide carboxypeptidase
LSFNSCQPPPSLKPGDLLRVIASSGALREFEAFERGIEIWRSRGYQVEVSTGIDERWGYLAGTDESRRQQLLNAWQDPQCRGILCARGGYGSARILENWQWIVEGQEDKGTKGHKRGGGAQEAEGEPIQNLKSKIQNPKWLIGFSDVTALLWSLGCCVDDSCF